MIRLNLTAQPRWIELLPGLRILAAPITTAVMASARSTLAASDLAEDTPREELAVAMAKAVAARVVEDWEGVADENGEAVTVTPEGINALLDIWPVFEAFQEQCLAPHLLVDAEKNGSAPSLNGISAGATDTAKPARGDAPTAHQP